MQTCDVLVVGGGPAGSACAGRLRAAGLDTLVLDRAGFPRDKPCAGWVTPDVFALVGLAPADYRFGCTLQPVLGIRMGLIGGPEVVIETGGVASYGIRRSEFDYRLLLRSGAPYVPGEAVTRVRRDAGRWIANEAFAAAVIVGAGGSSCPVGRLLNRPPPAAAFVTAEEVELRLDARQRLACGVRPEIAEIHFCRDLRGYGWCFRKGDYLNVGLGRRDPHGLRRHLREYIAWQVARRRIPADLPSAWRGHAYRLREAPAPTLVGDGILLVGDAAAAAFPESGEGIRPAIESGLLAAEAIVAAGGRCDRDDLRTYEAALERRLGPRRPRSALPPGLVSLLAPHLFASPWFVRRVVLDRWFLRPGRPAFPVPPVSRPPSAAEDAKMMRAAS